MDRGTRLRYLLLVVVDLLTKLGVLVGMIVVTYLVGVIGVGIMASVTR